MWIVLIGANEAILRRAPKNLNIIDVREGLENIIIRENYIQITMNVIEEDSLKKMLNPYLEEIKKFVSFSEKYLLLAAVLNEQFNLKSNSVSCVETLINKHKMRQVLKEYQTFFSQLTDTQDLKEFLLSVDFDVIVKPVDGTGSRLIGRYIVGQTNVDDFVQQYSALKEVLVEEYIRGKEYSVESISENGKHQIIAITEKFIDENFIEVAHISPANISDSMKKSISDYVIEFLDRMQVKEGCGHTEIIINDKGIYVVEGHPRTGGDRIVSLVRLTTGIDLIEAYLYQLSCQSYPIQRVRATFAQTLFINFREGTTYLGLPNLTKYCSHLDEIEVNVKIGAQVEKPLYSSMRHVMIVLYAKDYEQCKFLAHAIKNIFLENSVDKN